VSFSDVTVWESSTFRWCQQSTKTFRLVFLPNSISSSSPHHQRECQSQHLLKMRSAVSRAWDAVVTDVTGAVRDFSRLLRRIDLASPASQSSPHQQLMEDGGCQSVDRRLLSHRRAGGGGDKLRSCPRSSAACLLISPSSSSSASQNYEDATATAAATAGEKCALVSQFKQRQRKAGGNNNRGRGRGGTRKLTSNALDEAKWISGEWTTSDHNLSAQDTSQKASGTVLLMNCCSRLPCPSGTGKTVRGQQQRARCPHRRDNQRVARHQLRHLPSSPPLTGDVYKRRSPDTGLSGEAAITAGMAWEKPRITSDSQMLSDRRRPLSHPAALSPLQSQPKDLRKRCQRHQQSAVRRMPEICFSFTSASPPGPVRDVANKDDDGFAASPALDDAEHLKLGNVLSLSSSIQTNDDCDDDPDSNRKESGIYSGESDALSSCCSRSSAATSPENGARNGDAYISPPHPPVLSQTRLQWRKQQNSAYTCKIRAVVYSNTTTTTNNNNNNNNNNSNSNNDKVRRTSFEQRYCDIYERELDKTLEDDQWEEEADHVFKMAEVEKQRNPPWRRSDDESFYNLFMTSAAHSRLVCSSHNIGTTYGDTVYRRYHSDCDSLSDDCSSVSSLPEFSEDEDGEDEEGGWSSCWNDDEFRKLLQQRIVGFYALETVV
jgi:hypothetical protein